MPADSKLVTQMKTAAPGVASKWDQVEAAVEVLSNAIASGPTAGEDVNIAKVNGAAVTLAQLQTVAQKQLTGTPSNFTIQTADGTVFTLAAGEIGFIQNLDSADALAVKRGSGASTTSFSFILPCGTAADNGTGGLVIIDDWVGAVSVATMSGTARYISWKSAP